jgi:ankyrin repeat protein
MSEELIQAVKDNNIKLVKKIIQQGIDINYQTKNGNTALYWASRNGYTEIVELLLKVSGVNINIQYNVGNTALMFALCNSNKKIVKLLLKYGADVNKKNDYGYTALILASQYEETEIVKLLLKYKVDINIKEEIYGYTALEYAVERGYKDIIRLLKNYGNSTKKLNRCVKCKAFLPKSGICKKCIKNHNEKIPDKSETNDDIHILAEFIKNNDIIINGINLKVLLNNA